jgi:hypothetical protein
MELGRTPASASIPAGSVIPPPSSGGAAPVSATLLGDSGGFDIQEERIARSLAGQVRPLVRLHFDATT